MKRKKADPAKWDVFAAIGDPTRRQILYLLAAGTLSVQALAENFEISRPAISKHIKVLREAGLVKINESGRENLCELHPDGFSEIRDWLTFYESFWQSRMSIFGTVLDQHSRNKQKRT